MFGYRVLWGANQAGGSGGIDTPIHAWNLDTAPWEDAIASATLTAAGTPSATAVTGKIGNGVQFDGSSWLQSGAGAVPGGDVSFTFGIWVYLTASGSGYIPIASMGNSTDTDDWNVTFDGISFLFQLPGIQIFYDVFDFNTWYYIKVKWNAVTDKIGIAVNNSLLEIPDASYSIPGTTNPRLRIGAARRNISPIFNSIAPSDYIFDGAVYYDAYTTSETDDLDWNLGNGRAYP